MSKTNTTHELDLQQVKQRSLSGAVSYFGRTLLLQAVGFISAFALSYYFSPEDFGVYGFVLQIIGILTFFSDIGLAAALVQKKDEPSTSDYRTVFTVQQALSWLIVAIVGVVLMTGIVQEKTGEAGQWILIALALSFPLATLKTIPSILLERKLAFSRLVVPQIFEQLVFHGILIFMAIQGSGAIAYAYAIIVRSVVGAIVMLSLQSWNFGISLDAASLRTLLGFGVKFQLNDFLARIKDQLFYLFLAFVLPIKEFGYIQWAKNWSMYPYNLTVQNVLAITFPTFSRLQHNQQALKRAIEKSLFFITIVLFPIIVGMSVFITPFISLVPAWLKWSPAVPSLIFFCASIAWGAISTPLTNTLNAIGQINTTLKLMIMWTLLTWLITPLGIYFFGFNGVSMAAVAISFTSVLSIYYVKKYVPILWLEQVSTQFWASVCMSGVGIFGMSYWSQSFTHLFLGMFITSVSYGLMLLLLGREKVIREIRSLR